MLLGTRALPIALLPRKKGLPRLDCPGGRDVGIDAKRTDEPLESQRNEAFTLRSRWVSHRTSSARFLRG